MGDAWAAEAGPTDIPDDLAEWIKPELAPDERLIWASRTVQPRRKGRRGHAVAGAWAVGLLSLGAAGIALTHGQFSWSESAEAGLITLGTLGLVFGTLVGFAALGSLSAASRQYRLRSRQVYALTDRRAIIWAPVPNSDAVTVHVYPRGSIKPGQVERTQYPDGSGTLKLQGGYSAHGDFEGIAEVRRVEDLVRRFLVASEDGPTP